MRTYYWIMGILCCSATYGYQGTPALSDNSRRTPIQMGVQIMSGYKTNSIWRGWEMGKEVWENQIASSIALSNDWALAGEFDYTRNFSGRNFSHATLSAELQYYLGPELTIGPTLTGQWYKSCDFRNSLDTGANIRWAPTKDWEGIAQCLYDSGQEGWYGQFAITWQPLITESTAIQTTLALGSAYDYKNVNGPNELMLRTGFLIRLGSNFRLQPFIAYSYGLRSQNIRRLYGGCWVVFQF